MRNNSRIVYIGLLSIVVVLSALLTFIPINNNNRELPAPKQYTYDYLPVVSLVQEQRFSGPASLCSLFAGFGGFIQDENGVTHRFRVRLTSFSCGSPPQYTYNVEVMAGPFKSQTETLTVSNNTIPHVNFYAEFMRYDAFPDVGFTTFKTSADLLVVGYYDENLGAPAAYLYIYNYPNSYVLTTPTFMPIWINITNIVGVAPSPIDISQMYTRVYITPYTEAPTVGTFYNLPELLTMITVLKDGNGVTSTIRTIDLRNWASGQVRAPVTYFGSIMIPIAYLYSQDRSAYYLFFVSLSQSDPSTAQLCYAVLTSDGGFLTATCPTSISLPIQYFYPDIYVYYLNKPKFTAGTGYLVTAAPIKVALYSPTAQKIIELSIDINATIVDPTAYDITFSGSVAGVIDLTTVTGGDYRKALVTAIDFYHPKSDLVGILVFRQTVYDADVFYNPYGYKMWLYNTQWTTPAYKEIVPRVDYNYPKANVQPNYWPVYGVVEPMIIDMQVYSNDALSATGWIEYAFRLIPYQRYDVTPQKFTYAITYTYYVTPITITYNPTDPSYPTELSNVLVRIEIQNPYSIIAAPDARDVRFFLTNTYGGDYFLYSGLDYTIESINDTVAVFYVLIPNITAGQPLTIYMYSGFRYAQPVAKDYFAMISSYPILIPG